MCTSRRFTKFTKSHAYGQEIHKIHKSHAFEQEIHKIYAYELKDHRTRVCELKDCNIRKIHVVRPSVLTMVQPVVEDPVDDGRISVEAGAESLPGLRK